MNIVYLNEYADSLIAWVDVDDSSDGWLFPAGADRIGQMVLPEGLSWSPDYEGGRFLSGYFASLDDLRSAVDAWYSRMADAFVVSGNKRLAVVSAADVLGAKVDT